MDAISVFVQGLVMSAALIVAIGAQNAFVLRQGTRREHLAAVVLWCAASDTVLITAGVLGLGRLLALWPALAQGMAWAGAAYLLAFAVGALRRAWHPGSLHAGPRAAGASLKLVLVQAAAFTFLNPHVYLDTVVLLGSVGGRHPVALQPAFIAGGATASTLWFSALGYGAWRIGPWLARPRVWRWIECGIGLTMLWLAAILLHGVLA